MSDGSDGKDESWSSPFQKTAIGYILPDSVLGRTVDRAITPASDSDDHLTSQHEAMCSVVELRLIL